MGMMSGTDTPVCSLHVQGSALLQKLAEQLVGPPGTSCSWDSLGYHGSPREDLELEPGPRLAVAVLAVEAKVAAMAAKVAWGERRDFALGPCQHCGGRRAAHPSLKAIPMHLCTYELSSLSGGQELRR